MGARIRCEWITALNVYEIVVRSKLSDEKSFLVPPDFAPDSKDQPIVYRISEILSRAKTPGRQQFIIDQIQVCNRRKRFGNLPSRHDMVQKSIIVIVPRILRSDMCDSQRR